MHVGQPGNDELTSSLNHVSAFRYCRLVRRADLRNPRSLDHDHGILIGAPPVTSIKVAPVITLVFCACAHAIRGTSTGIPRRSEIGLIEFFSNAYWARSVHGFARNVGNPTDHDLAPIIIWRRRALKNCCLLYGRRTPHIVAAVGTRRLNGVDLHLCLREWVVLLFH